MSVVHLLRIICEKIKCAIMKWGWVMIIIDVYKYTVAIVDDVAAVLGNERIFLKIY